jgi:ABC-2 type transport system ATP-binding protein
VSAEGVPPLNAVIEAIGVKKNFGDKEALKGVDCAVAEREIFGLLGPSGAGKTTLIKIFTGQITASDGEAHVFGVSSDKITDEIYSKIGMVLDNSGLYTRLTCYDNLALFADIYGINKRVIPEIIEKVKLAEAAKRAVSKLSKGMTQRLVLARAIIHNPQLLFLDEPTNGLDPATALEIHTLIFELRDRGATVFLTTHNMEEAHKLCDNVALLNEGVIVEYGPPDAVCRKYDSQRSVTIVTRGGHEATLPNNPSSAQSIAKFFEDDRVESIHSSEPNLETVFIALTGRKLV